jgi:hypothetical protein
MNWVRRSLAQPQEKHARLYPPPLLFYLLFVGVAYPIIDLVRHLWKTDEGAYLQIIANHHLQNQIKLPVGDVPVSVHIVDLESNYSSNLEMF